MNLVFSWYTSWGAGAWQKCDESDVRGQLRAQDRRGGTENAVRQKS